MDSDQIKDGEEIERSAFEEPDSATKALNTNKIVPFD